MLNLAFGTLRALEVQANGQRLCGIELLTKLRMCIAQQLVAQGATLTSGMAPPMALERVVQRDLNRLSRRR